MNNFLKQIHSFLYKNKLLRGFSLAELFLTIGIIGVIMALTLPTVITHYQKKVTVTRLREFYSIINNALYTSIAKNGDLQDLNLKSSLASYQDNLNWSKDHLLPFIKYNEVKKCKTSSYHTNTACIYLHNGDSFAVGITPDGMDIPYCIRCDVASNVTPENPKKKFWFQYYKRMNGTKDKNKFNSKNLIQPYSFNWDGNVNSLKTHSKYGCRRGNTRFEYCTKYIEVSDWKIPNDYPW